jgi:hypothetical protein
VPGQLLHDKEITIMRWRKISTTLIVGGLLLMVCGLRAWPVQGAAPTRPLAQPSPRPTLMPTATPALPTAAPSATPAATSSASKSHATTPAAGRITGTIIDLTSGAPVPGITVDLDGLQVTSDSNGNYDHWLPPGSYRVALMLAPERGTPAQGPQMVDMQSDKTVVLHLSFRSPPLPTSTPPPATAAPVAATAVIAHPAGASTRATKPTRLPVTGEQPSSAWLWLLIGMMLLVMGGALELKGAWITAALPARAPHLGRVARPSQPARMASKRVPAGDPLNLLAELLAAAPRPTHSAGAAAARPATEHDELLAALLREPARASRPTRRL